jgi:hypothetical protein
VADSGLISDGVAGHIVATRDEPETAVEITSSGVEVIEDGTAAPLWGDPARA